MKRSLEKNLEAMTPAERDEAIEKLQKITWEITKYSRAFLWEGHGKTKWRTEITVELGTDIIEFSSDYYESYRHCYYIKSLTHNGSRTTCTLVKNIIAKLRELNGVVDDDSIFL